MKAVVRLENVEKTFPRAKTPALTNLSAEIRRGVVTGLVGPDGAGKTTLMRLIAGLMLPTSGGVSVRGGSVLESEHGSPDRRESQDSPTAVPTEELREFIGYMPQKFGLYEDLTVQENLTLHADLRGVIGAERETAFQRLLAFTD